MPFIVKPGASPSSCLGWSFHTCPYVTTVKYPTGQCHDPNGLPVLRFLMISHSHHPQSLANTNHFFVYVTSTLLNEDTQTGCNFLHSMPQDPYKSSQAIHSSSLLRSIASDGYAVCFIIHPLDVFVVFSFL